MKRCQYYILGARLVTYRRDVLLGLRLRLRYDRRSAGHGCSPAECGGRRRSRLRTQRRLSAGLLLLLLLSLSLTTAPGQLLGA